MRSCSSAGVLELLRQRAVACGWLQDRARRIPNVPQQGINDAGRRWAEVVTLAVVVGGLGGMPYSRAHHYSPWSRPRGGSALVMLG